MVSTSISRFTQSGRTLFKLRNSMSSRVILPLMPLRIAPLGDLVAKPSRDFSLISGCLANNSSSCCRLTVIPAFLMPTPCFLSASIASRTTCPLLTSRCSAERSISTSSISSFECTKRFRISSKATCAISSPWRITKGFLTAILALTGVSSR